MVGVDLPTVKEMMGHKDITMTLRYTHLSSDHKRQASRQNAGSVWGKVPTISPTGLSGDLGEQPQVIDRQILGR
jgi:hypothetical protein